ncbi:MULTISPECIES: alpha/beta hydrolase [Leptolyngbya]|uniref:alpha/beta hydrolase n=1 Tax=Leptolyngbya TaxID=47251 RepID=UPI0016891B63|nr:alpha/beta hydrolase-fold protein [Leptolyngbya sp. FACHB-1624]MBD1854790.1 esterase family protein [Leptolyngbya sp. FACHB-1624]
MTQGRVQEGLTIASQILGKPIRYTIYLPDDYDTSVRSYPVVYLLHGNRADDTSWISYGEVHLTADELIATRTIPPMILVMPDGGNSRYINNCDRSLCYEDFFFQEFMPAIESTYRIKSDKWFRGVLGLSMGGYGAIVYALKHPEVFSTCVSFSPSIYTDEMILKMTDTEWASNRAAAHGAGLTGVARLTDHYKSYDPFRIAEATDPEWFKTLKLYLDCGDQDFRNEGVALFHIRLRQLNIAHDYRVRSGSHTWSYWRSGLAPALQFMGTTFRRS